MPPTDYLEEKQSFISNTGFNELCPCEVPKVKMETFAVLTVQPGAGAAFPEFPAKVESGHADGGCSCVAGQGLVFLFS